MKIGVVGCNSRKDKDTVESLIVDLPDDSTIVSGGNDGVDSWAIEAARNRGLKTIELYPYIAPPDSPAWEIKKSVKSHAKKIVENSEVIYAFPSEDVTDIISEIIKHAKRISIPVEMVEVE